MLHVGLADKILSDRLLQSDWSVVFLHAMTTHCRGNLYSPQNASQVDSNMDHRIDFSLSNHLIEYTVTVLNHWWPGGVNLHGSHGTRFLIGGKSDTISGL